MTDTSTSCSYSEEKGWFVLKRKHRNALLSNNNNDDELFSSELSKKNYETYHRLGYVLIRATAGKFRLPILNC